MFIIHIRRQMVVLYALLRNLLVELARMKEKLAATSKCELLKSGKRFTNAKSYVWDSR